jgi:hypothetical protein
MKLAAGKMTLRQNDVLELTPSCDIEAALLADERLKLILDPTGLFLHSLCESRVEKADKQRMLRFFCL